MAGVKLGDHRAQSPSILRDRPIADRLRSSTAAPSQTSSQSRVQRNLFNTRHRGRLRVAELDFVEDAVLDAAINVGRKRIMSRAFLALQYVPVGATIGNGAAKDDFLSRIHPFPPNLTERRG